MTSLVVDYDSNKGDSKKMTIGNGCARKLTRPCDILEFVEFINVDGKKPVLNMRNAPNGWDPVDLKPEHVDWTAKALRDAGATGMYNPSKIHKAASRMGVDSLFGKIGDYIRGAQYADVPPNTLECAKKGVNAWADMRKWAQALSFQEFLENKYKDALQKQYPKDPKLVSVDMQVGESTVMVKTMNVPASTKKLRTLPDMEKYQAHTDLDPWKIKDPGHDVKVALARKAQEDINGGCL